MGKPIIELTIPFLLFQRIWLYRVSLRGKKALIKIEHVRSDTKQLEVQGLQVVGDARMVPDDPEGHLTISIKINLPFSPKELNLRFIKVA